MAKWTYLSLFVLLPCFTGCGDSGPEACYSPSSNLSSADQPGAVGCACNPAVDQDVCIQGKGLTCIDGRWQAVVDGPCMPLPNRDAATDENPAVPDSGPDGVPPADVPDATSEGAGWCYSPTSNLSLAEQPGAVGCACNPAVDQDVCVQGKGLMCMSGRWQAVIDGPCMPQPRRDAAVDENPIVLDSGLDGVSRADAPDGATEDVSSCYSPTSDLSLAEQPGATGCACNPAVDRDVCVRGMGLMCMNGRWQLVIDGPCMPSPDGSSHPESNAADAPVDAAVHVEGDAATETAEAGGRCGDSTCQPGG
jgi:hypothetical protein